MMIGEREKAAKKAVDEHKIRGSLRSSNPNDFLKARIMHLKLFIGIFQLWHQNNLHACPSFQGLLARRFYDFLQDSGRYTALLSLLNNSGSISSYVGLPLGFIFYLWSESQTLVNKPHKQ
jgi:hypothetical protein